MARAFALIGVGGIGGYHLASMQGVAQRGGVRPVAVAEPNVDKFVELRRQLQAQGVRWYLDYREMLHEEADLDLISVATPIHLHDQMARACLERGVLINLEKPPVPLIQQLTSLIELDGRQQVTVGFQMILSRCMQRMKELIVGGTIGEVRHIRACGCWPRGDRYYQRTRWAGKLTLDGEPVFDGPATNALAHLLHNIMFLAGSGAGKFAVPSEVRGELYRARPIESYDVASLRGTFASGAEFCLAVAHAVKDSTPFRIEVRGSRGWLRLSEDGALLETSAGERLHAPETTQELLDVCYVRLADAFGGSDRRPYTTLEDTLGYVRATNGLYLSSGGVHDIPREWVGTVGEAGDRVYDVRGLSAEVEQVFAEGRLFSELGTAWAVARPVSVPLDSFQSIELGVPALMPAA